VQRILTFSRPQDQKLEIFQLAPVVEEALQLMRATLPAMIEIRTQFAPDVPAIAGNTTQIHQIIINLATNSAHAIGDRRGLINVRVDAVHIDVERAADSPGLQEGLYVHLTVHDDGHGMDRDTLERIFDPFFTTKPTGQGTGLGLSVVHGIIRGHAGTISAYSEPGKGTVFHLYFPAVAGDIKTAPVVQQGIQRQRTEHVLYVDDEEALVSLTTRLLKRLGYTVTGHTDPQAALQQFRSSPRNFDAVVTDLAMRECQVSNWPGNSERRGLTCLLF